MNPTWILDGSTLEANPATPEQVLFALDENMQAMLAEAE
jgi:hypothetical protein